MSEAFPSLTGHAEAVRQIAEAFKSARMHHAWLLTGPEGIGKATLAKHIATYVLSGGAAGLDGANPEHPAAKLVAAGAHPDLLTVGRAADDEGTLRKTIAVDDVRKIPSFLHTTSSHGGWRVTIVDEAHLLNRNGQNAILKILEEPSDRALILMVATTAGALLPTIRSRCRVLPLAPLDEKHMRAILARTAPELSAEDAGQLIELSGGSIGFAQKIMRAEVLPLYAELRELIAAMPALDIARLHKLADQIARKADVESYEVLTALLIEYLHRDVRNAAIETSGPALDRRLRVWDKVGAIFAAADGANLDRRLAFINAVAEIRAAA